MDTRDDVIQIRFASDDDLQAVYENQARAFGMEVHPRDVEAWKRRVKPEDILVAEDFSESQHPLLVGTSLCYRLRFTVPGGVSLSAAWLTMATVSATHHGRGIWQRLSAEGAGILLDRGYSFICGVPVQPTAYQTLGAGVVSYARTHRIQPHVAELRCPPARNRAREATADEARRQLPKIYERWCATTPGALSRDGAWWDDFLEDRPTQRNEGSALNFVIHPDGFLTYRVVGAPPHAFRPPFGSLVVQDFCAITDDAHTALLATLLAMEVFDTIEIETPVDDPLALKLKDLRAAQTTDLSDFLWIRIMNVPEALDARAYSADADVVLEVADPLSAAGGRFLLQTRDGVGTCKPYEGPADIEIGLGELATIYMGAHRASELHRANRLTELRRGTLRNLDAAFGTERAPYCGTMF